MTTMQKRIDTLSIAVEMLLQRAELDHPHSEDVVSYIELRNELRNLRYAGKSNTTSQRLSQQLDDVRLRSRLWTMERVSDPWEVRDV